MSEFSESYHLETDQQQAGIHLLQQANLDGVVFPPRHGWVTILPRSKVGQLPEALIHANDLDIEMVQALAKRHGHGPQLGRQLKRILHPHLERRTDEETGAQFAGFADWDWSHLVAYAFAELVALPHYEWLRWRDDTRDEGRWVEHGAVRVRRPRHRFPSLWTHP